MEIARVRSVYLSAGGIRSDVRSEAGRLPRHEPDRDAAAAPKLGAPRTGDDLTRIMAKGRKKPRRRKRQAGRRAHGGTQGPIWRALVAAKRGWLSQISAHDLQERVAAFERRDFRELDREAIRRIANEVLMVGGRAMLPAPIGHYRAGTTFVRARTLEISDHYLPLRAMRTVADCWEPPAHVVGWGRLNAPREPMLYTTAGTAETAADELGIPDDVRFSLIQYRARSPVQVAWIGRPADSHGLTQQQAVKWIGHRRVSVAADDTARNGGRGHALVPGFGSAGPRSSSTTRIRTHGATRPSSMRGSNML